MGEVGKAFVVGMPGTQASEAELIAWSRENMANYKVPRNFVFVEDLPRNASGKVLKDELRSH
jgi:acyl-CoA synthetase (AMP-forming)/AMP-acid ligase II